MNERMRHVRRTAFEWAVILGAGVLFAWLANGYASDSPLIPAQAAQNATPVPWTVSQVHYALNSANPTRIDMVTFTMSPPPSAPASVSISLQPSGPTYPCSFAGPSATCSTTSPQALVLPSTLLKVSVASGGANCPTSKNQAKTNWTSVNWAGCDLSGFNFNDATLTGANLNLASLASANLSGARLTNANLNDASFNKANLSGANLTGASAIGADFSGANLNDANFSNANLTGANFAGASMNGMICNAGTINCPPH